MRLRSFFAAAIVVLGLVLPCRAGDIYVLTNNAIDFSGTTTDFGKIDSATGAYTSIASLNTAVGNLAWNPTANNFFVTVDDGATTLRTLTLDGSLSGSLGAIGRELWGMAYRTADSTLYGYDFNDATGTINSSTGAWSLLNSSPGVSVLSPVGGHYSIMNDQMYVAGNNLSNGGFFGTIGYTASSSVSTIRTGEPAFRDMVLANDGTTMYGIFGDSSNTRLYTIDTNTGVATDTLVSITGTGLGDYFHGAAILPVPEPSTWALAAIASGLLACQARRGRKTCR